MDGKEEKSKTGHKNRKKGRITLENIDTLKRRLFFMEEAIELVKLGKWRFTGNRSYLNNSL